MSEEFSFERYDTDDLSINEYMIYFLGLGEGKEKSLSVEELVEKVPRNTQNVAQELEKLEKDGYLESNEKGSYITESKGFNDILEDTRFKTVNHDGSEDSKYFWLGDKGLAYVESRDLEKLRPSIQYAFESE